MHFIPSFLVYLGHISLMVPFMRDELETILNQLWRLIFRKDALDKADSPLKRLNKWLTKTKHQLEDGLWTLGQPPKIFWKKYGSLLKVEGSSRVYISSWCWIWFSNFGENTFKFLSCQKRMIRQPKQTSIRFRALAYKLFSLKKISSDVADQAKNQYDELLNLVKYEKNNEFRNFDSKKDRLDAFLCK